MGSFASVGRGAFASLLVLGGLLCPASPHAQPANEFYRGKTVSVIIGYPPGGIFDTAARLLIRHLPRHLPGNPQTVPRNMPGAGSLIAANHLYNLAAKDGTEIGLIGGTVPFGPLWNRDGVQFDAMKFNWIGSMQRWHGVALVRSGAPVQTFEQAKQKELTVGATGSGDVTVIYPRILNALAGTKFKVIPGYVGSTDLNLAIEQGEVDGRLGWCWECVKLEKPGWIADKRISAMLQLTFTPHPELGNTPTLSDIATTEEAKQIMGLVFSGQQMAIPFVAPPGVPAERVAVLRKAFEDTIKDPEFLAEAQRINVQISPLTSDKIEALLKAAYATPAATVEKAAKIILGQ